MSLVAFANVLVGPAIGAFLEQPGDGPAFLRSHPNLLVYIPVLGFLEISRLVSDSFHKKTLRESLKARKKIDVSPSSFTELHHGLTPSDSWGSF
jgi:hypothetical protein